MELVRYENGTLTVNMAGATTLAVIAILPTFIAAILGHIVMSRVDAASIALEQRKANTAAFQAALAHPDPAQRELILDFLIATEALPDNGTIRELSAAEIPPWPPSPTPP